MAVADFNLEEKNQVELNKFNELLDNLPERDVYKRQVQNIMKHVSKISGVEYGGS